MSQIQMHTDAQRRTNASPRGAPCFASVQAPGDVDAPHGRVYHKLRLFRYFGAFGAGVTAAAAVVVLTCPPTKLMSTNSISFKPE